MTGYEAYVSVLNPDGLTKRRFGRRENSFRGRKTGGEWSGEDSWATVSARDYEQAGGTTYVVGGDLPTVRNESLDSTEVVSDTDDLVWIRFIEGYDDGEWVTDVKFIGGSSVAAAMSAAWQAYEALPSLDLMADREDVWLRMSDSGIVPAAYVVGWPEDMRYTVQRLGQPVGFHAYQVWDLALPYPPYLDGDLADFVAFGKAQYSIDANTWKIVTDELNELGILVSRSEVAQAPLWGARVNFEATFERVQEYPALGSV